jgi:signal transduction histidine kinase
VAGPPEPQDVNVDELRAERLVARVLRVPADRRLVLRNDALLAAAVIAVSVALALLSAERPTVLGWTLLLSGQIPLIWRRLHPELALAAMIPLVGAYHALGYAYTEYAHFAAVPGSMTLLFTFASLSRPLRTFLVGVFVIGAATVITLATNSHDVTETVQVSGWIVAVLIAGANVRVYRRYLAATTDRAERAERTREEEAGRRVAEERVRIARDLHDLLAHSITLIGVRTAVASHLLTVDPSRLDRAALATALDEVAETCRSARVEVRTTLEVLRDESTSEGPLPDLSSLPALATTAGARLTLRAEAAVPPAVAAAAYRIVQEALTNTVRHAGPAGAAQVTVEAHDAELHISIIDDGPLLDPVPGDSELLSSGSGSGSSSSGFGLIGMRERARSVGGTLVAGPLPRRGFAVTAVLPLRSPALPSPAAVSPALRSPAEVSAQPTEVSS